MLRLLQVAVVAALLWCAGPAGPVSASSAPGQPAGSATPVAAAPQTVAPPRDGEPRPVGPAAIDSPVADERPSEVVIVLLGLGLSAVGLASFHATGKWMHRRAKAKELRAQR